MHQDFMTSYFDLQLCFFITDISPLGCTLSDNFNGIFATSFLYYTFFVFISIFKRFPVLQEVEEGEKEELHIIVYMNIFFQRFILIPVTSGFSFFSAHPIWTLSSLFHPVHYLIAIIKVSLIVVVIFQVSSLNCGYFLYLLTATTFSVF